MRLIHSVCVAALVTGLLGCSGPSVQYDYDSAANFTQYKSYNWVMAGGHKGRAAGFNNPIMEDRVVRAVEAELATKGYQKDEEAQPDFLVSYTLTGRGVRSRVPHLGLGLGFGLGGAGLGLGVGAPIGESKEESVGSIILEIQDGHSRAVIWRATADGVLRSTDSPKEADAAVAGAVRSMFKRFPPPAK